jgi:alkylation response protein AidB-like acyl-CoA dehydrogenase
MATMSEVGIDSVKAAVRRIAPIVEKHRDEGETQRRLAEPIVQALRDEGFYKLWTAKEYGGDEVPLPVFMTAVEEIAKLDGSTAWVFANLGAGAMMPTGFPAETARQFYVNGPNVPIPGSIVPRGHAVPVDGGYRLNGRWPYGSGVHFCEWLGCASLVFDGDAPRMLPFGAPDLQLMFFPIRDVTIHDTWDSVGLRGTGSTDFEVKDLFVPESLVYSFIEPPVMVSGPLYRAGQIILFGMALNCVPLGIARRAIDAFVQLALDKVPTLSQTPLGARPTIHAEVARAEATLQSARALMYSIAEEITASLEATGAVPEEMETRERLACVNAAEASCSVVERVWAMAGASPISRGHVLEQCLRDVRVASQHWINSPAWWEKAGQFYLGHGLGMP